jgi:hypothetical protein
MAISPFVKWILSSESNIDAGALARRWIKIMSAFVVSMVQSKPLGQRNGFFGTLQIAHFYPGFPLDGSLSCPFEALPSDA